MAGSQTSIGSTPVHLIHISRLNRAALEAILHIAGRLYARDHDPTVGFGYFASHCEQCRALFRDQKPIGSGPDMTERGAPLYDVDVPIIAAGAGIEGCPLPSSD